MLELANGCLAEQGRPAAYRLHVMSLDGGPIPLFAGVEVNASRSLRGYRGPVDTLIVVGGPRADEASEDPALARVLETEVNAAAFRAHRERRFFSFC